MIFIENFSNSDEHCSTILFLFNFKNEKKFKMIIVDFEPETDTAISSIKLRSRDTNVYSFLKDSGWINNHPVYYNQQQSLINSYGY